MNIHSVVMTFTSMQILPFFCDSGDSLCAAPAAACAYRMVGVTTCAGSGNFALVGAMGDLA